ncbi:MAG: DUF6141 family protein [Candidatus Saccharicenans sp.]
MEDSPIIYEERQKLNLGLLWLPILVPVVLLWYGFYHQIIKGKPFGNHPVPDQIFIIFFVIIGIIFPGLMSRTALILQVRTDGFYFRYYPFHWRYQRVSWLEIRLVEAISFSAVSDFGGYGIKYFKGGKAYIAKGAKGIRVSLASGKQIIFSSDNPEMLLGYMGGRWHSQP